MVEQVTQFVQETERRAPTDARDTQVDRVSLAKAIRAGFTDRRGWTHGNRLEIGPDSVQAGRRSERPLKLPRERAPSRQQQDLVQGAEPRLAFTCDAVRVPALSHR